MPALRSQPARRHRAAWGLLFTDPRRAHPHACQLTGPAAGGRRANPSVTRQGNRHLICPSTWAAGAIVQKRFGRKNGSVSPLLVCVLGRTRDGRREGLTGSSGTTLPVCYPCITDWPPWACSPQVHSDGAPVVPRGLARAVAAPSAQPSHREDCPLPSRQCPVVANEPLTPQNTQPFRCLN